MNPIVAALIEDEDFKMEIDRLVDLANSTDELPLDEQIDQAISEHDMVLNLVARVEELEEKFKKLDIDLSNRIEQLKQPTVQPFPEVKSEGTLKPFDIVECSTFWVAEDENNKDFLTRKWKGQWQVVGLYRVTFPLPSGPVTRYVLAESAEGAAGQAGYSLKELAELSAADHAACQQDTTITRLPLMLRGWSDKQF